jgi:hypothetical protein
MPRKGLELEERTLQFAVASSISPVYCPDSTIKRKAG